MSEAKKRHPFSYTLGPGPYKWVGTFDLGAVMAALAAGNVFGYQNGLAAMPQLEAGSGTCAHCGHSITLIQIVKTSEGKLYGVGSDCIMKVNGEGMIERVSEMERKLRLINRKKGQERRETQRAKLAQECSALVAANIDRLALTPVDMSTCQNALEYSNWYLNRPHSLGGYKIFKKKLTDWGCK